MCDESVMNNVHFELNQNTYNCINDLNNIYENDKNKYGFKIVLDYRKNIPNIPIEQYQSNNPNDLLLVLCNSFTLNPIAYVHITLHCDAVNFEPISIEIECIKTIDLYRNLGKCKLLLSILILLSRLLNPNINMIHLDSINYKLSYLCIFEFDAIPQVIYYKSIENDFSSDIKNEKKCNEFKDEVAEMKNKSKEEKYKYIENFDAQFGNDLFLIIDIDDSLLVKISHEINNYH